MAYIQGVATYKMEHEKGDELWKKLKSLCPQNQPTQPCEVSWEIANKIWELIFDVPYL